MFLVSDELTEVLEWVLWYLTVTNLEKENHGMENNQVVWCKDYVKKNTWR